MSYSFNMLWGVSKGDFKVKLHTLVTNSGESDAAMYSNIVFASNPMGGWPTDPLLE